MKTTNLLTANRRRPRRLALACLGATTLFGGAAMAHIVSVTGLVVLIPAPFGVMLPGPDIHAFDEKQDVVLTAPLPVDVLAINPPLQVPGPGVQSGMIPAGTCVRSHYLHFDPVNPPGGVVGVGGVAFDRDIIGVALRPFALNATNVLGAPGTFYPPDAGAGPCIGLGANADCGLELGGGDRVLVGQRKVKVDWSASNPGDRMRVITKGCCDSSCTAATD